MRLSESRGFVAATAIFVLLLAASAAPTPLYVVYQQEWHFSATTLTGVFAIYAVGLLGSLLVLGELSDHVGRRPVLIAALALDGLAMLLFLLAGGVVPLALARLLQGIATGAAMTTLSATLVDLDPPHAPGRAGLVNSIAPTSAIALGALACGALVQWAPSPTRLVWALLLAGMGLAIAAVWSMPESSPRTPGALGSLQPQVGVPPALRADVVGLVPTLVASWALGGFYLALGPSVAAGLFGQRNHLIGGLVVSLLCGTGAITSFSVRTRPPRQLLAAAALLMAAGTGVTLAGVQADTAWLAAAGTILAGTGFGSAALGCFGTLARIAPPDERGAVFAFALVVSYLSFSLPAVLAGLAATRFGLKEPVLVFGATVSALSVLALVAQQVLGRRTAPAL